MYVVAMQMTSKVWASGSHNAALSIYLCKCGGIQVPFSCAVCQSPYFGKQWPWQLTSLKELDRIWPSQLVVVI